MTKKITLLLGSLALSSASAILPIGDLYVDFRTNVWSRANGVNTFNVGDITIDATPATANLFQDSVDGIGISGGEPDEVDNAEMLKVTFAGTSGNGLNGVWILDLFEERTTDVPDAKFGFLKINGTTTIDFIGLNSDQANGEQFISFGGPVDDDMIEFYARVGTSVDEEFSIAGFTKK